METYINYLSYCPALKIESKCSIVGKWLRKIYCEPGSSNRTEETEAEELHLRD